MQSFAFQIVVTCPLDLAFAVYTDLDRWRQRTMFGDIQWVKGNPWEEGSRLRIETTTPLRATIDQVLQHFVQNEQVGYLSHVLGMTCETRVVFVRISDLRTEINVEMQLIGKVTRTLGFALEPIIMKTTKEFFEVLRQDCEAAARDRSANK